jgi:hypothetical protein
MAQARWFELIRSHDTITLSSSDFTQRQNGDQQRCYLASSQSPTHNRLNKKKTILDVE